MGRNVSEKTMNERYTAVFGLIAKHDKVTEIVRAGMVDAENRLKAADRKRKANEDFYKSLNLGDDVIRAMLNRDGVSDEAEAADRGRVEAGADLLEAIAKVAKHLPTLRHYIVGSADGKELINDLF